MGYTWASIQKYQQCKPDLWNKTRNHVLDGIWIEQKTIANQREVLEGVTNQIVGSISGNTVKKRVLDTSNLTKMQVVEKFNGFLNDLERDEI